MVLSRDVPASRNLGWLLMENFGLCYTMPFWSLGPQKPNVVLNYSEAHISSVSKKSTPTGKERHKLFIALVSDLEWEQGAGLPLWLLGEISVDLWVAMLCLVWMRVVHRLVSGGVCGSGPCPSTDLPSSFCGARNGFSHTLPWGTL